jgi:hypothetical protein
MPAILYRAGDFAFDLYVGRSYALFMIERLTDAAEEFACSLGRRAWLVWKIQCRHKQENVDASILLDCSCGRRAGVRRVGHSRPGAVNLDRRDV